MRKILLFLKEVRGMERKEGLLFSTKKLDINDKREIMMSIVNIFQERGLSHHQAHDLLDDTKEQLGHILINFNRQ